MMMKMILDRVNPLTRVGVKNLISKLNNMRLPEYGQDVSKLLDEFLENKNEIVARGGHYSNLAAALFDALLSLDNAEFKQVIQDKMNFSETGGSVTWTSVRDIALTKWNNMHARSETSKSLSYKAAVVNKPDDRNATILALRSKLDSHKTKQGFGGNGGSSGNGGSNGNGRKFGIDGWNMKKTTSGTWKKSRQYKNGQIGHCVKWTKEKKENTLNYLKQDTFNLKRAQLSF